MISEEIGRARNGKTPREAAVKGKMRKLMGEVEIEREREGGILEILPHIDRIHRGGAAEGFDPKSSMNV